MDEKVKAYKRRKRRRILGFTLTEIAVVATLVSSVPAASYVRVKRKADQTTCVNQLKQIGMSLQSYQMSHDKYPDSAFYPKSHDHKRSIVSELKGEGAIQKLFVCPSLPDKLKEKKITFVYNDSVSGKRRVPANTWVLIEMTCVSKNSPLPHPNGYNILYADGSVKTVRDLPADLKKLQK